MRTIALVTLLSCLGCADGAEPSGPTRPPAAPPSNAGGSAKPMAVAGSAGFGNPMPAAAPMAAGSGGGGGTAPRPPASTSACKPGLYVGTYDCEVDLFGLPLPLAGDVTFNLSIDETAVPGECDSEFCPDLVISENSGTLFGLAGLIAFEAKLKGALDCETGVFKAEGVGGNYGNGVSTDPNDPDAPWTVEEPPLGMFAGMLSGMHRAGPPESIEGSWNLADTTLSGASCNGPFKVTLQAPGP